MFCKPHSETCRFAVSIAGLRCIFYILSYTYKLKIRACKCPYLDFTLVKISSVSLLGVGLLTAGTFYFFSSSAQSTKAQVASFNVHASLDKLIIVTSNANGSSAKIRGAQITAVSGNTLQLKAFGLNFTVNTNSNSQVWKINQTTGWQVLGSQSISLFLAVGDIINLDALVDENTGVLNAQFIRFVSGGQSGSTGGSQTSTSTSTSGGSTSSSASTTLNASLVTSCTSTYQRDYQQCLDKLPGTGTSIIDKIKSLGLNTNEIDRLARGEAGSCFNVAIKNFYLCTGLATNQCPITTTRLQAGGQCIQAYKDLIQTQTQIKELNKERMRLSGDPRARELLDQVRKLQVTGLDQQNSLGGKCLDFWLLPAGLCTGPNYAAFNQNFIPILSPDRDPLFQTKLCSGLFGSSKFICRGLLGSFEGWASKIYIAVRNGTLPAAAPSSIQSPIHPPSVP